MGLTVCESKYPPFLDDTYVDLKFSYFKGIL